MSDSLTGDVLVPAYFIATSLVIAFLSYKFLSKKTATFKFFGIGLAFFAVAFAIWSAVVLTKPTDLETFTTLGVLPFSVGLYFFLMAGTSKLKASNRSLAMMLGVGYLALMLFLRTFVYQSAPAFSENGLFYFHADPVIVALYIGAFAAALFPATNAVSQQIKDGTLKFVTQLALTMLIIGGVVMLTSFDDTLQLINGYVMAVALAALLVAYSTKELK